MEPAALIFSTTVLPTYKDKMSMDVITEHVGNLSTCTTEILPSIDEYYTAFNIWGFVLFSMGGVAVTIIFASYIDTLKHVMKNAPPIVKTHSAFVVSVYPV
ncbi:uncharacterized protein LOC120353513, partial [Nilaparvata lugens]|uniref:uncharacterized protein LOC120353513 n=1 Tax=Nilaparvata lugens TaxID=108931 RepID=UPI00193C89E7